LCRGRAEWRLALCKRRADSGGYDDRIAMPMNVHDRAITARAKVKDKLIGTLNRREWD